MENYCRFPIVSYSNLLFKIKFRLINVNKQILGTYVPRTCGLAKVLFLFIFLGWKVRMGKGKGYGRRGRGGVDRGELNNKATSASTK